MTPPLLVVRPALNDAVVEGNEDDPLVEAPPPPVAKTLPAIVPVHAAPIGQHAACPTESSEHCAFVEQQTFGALMLAQEL